MASGVESRFFGTATIVLLGLLLTTLNFAGADQIGVCYGRIGTGLPSPSAVVSLYDRHGIGKMRIYDPHQPTLQALTGSNIILILGIANPDLQSIASSQENANQWVLNNVINYLKKNVKIRYIAVGNEVSPIKPDTAQYVPFVLQAMTNIYNSLRTAGLSREIKVSTAIETGLTTDTSPPSKGVFRPEVGNYINPIIQFLQMRNYPLLANIYPYFAHVLDSNVPLDFALFRSGANTGDGFYPSLFDAMVDATYWAVEKAGGTSVEIVVSESGWPSFGETAAATVENARTYNQNMIRHVISNKGTPKKPGRSIETYVFAMFDENQKKGPEIERHFGLFSANGELKYPIN